MGSLWAYRLNNKRQLLSKTYINFHKSQKGSLYEKQQ